LSFTELKIKINYGAASGSAKLYVYFVLYTPATTYIIRLYSDN